MEVYRLMLTGDCQLQLLSKHLYYMYTYIKYVEVCQLLQLQQENISGHFAQENSAGPVFWRSL